MSKYFDGSSLGDISYYVLSYPTHPMVSDGSSLVYSNPQLISRTDEIGSRLRYTVPTSGDFEVSSNLTIPDFTDWVMNQNGGVYMDFYVYFNASVYNTDGSDSANNFDFYMYEDKTQPNGIVFKEYNFAVPITLSYPFTGDLKVTKVGTTVSILVGENVLWTGTHANNATVAVTYVDIQFNYELNAEAPAYPVSVPTIKLNDVNFVGNTVSTVANLASIKANGLNFGVVSPSFAVNTLAYTLPAGFLASEIRFDLIASDSTSTITINGIPAQSNLTSTAFPLEYGANVFAISVAASDGVTVKTYTVTVNRNASASNIATLSEIYGYTLTPTFNATVYSYSYTMPYGTYSKSFRISKTNAFANIKINGVAHVSGQYYYFYNLVSGDNIQTIEVTAEDGVTVQTYTLNLYMTPVSHDAGLTSLIVSGTYGSSIGPDTTNPCRKFTMVQNSTYDYTATGCRAYNDVVLVYVAKSSTFSTVTINGLSYIETGYPNQRRPTHLVGGDNDITVVCTAQDGTTVNTYIIHVNKPVKYAFAQGTGYSDDPYQIWTPQDLDGVRDWSGCEYFTQNYGLPYTYFKQMADIDLSGYPNWVPLGTLPDESDYKCGYFTNYYDGNGFAVTNLTITGNTTHARIGLFDTVGMPLFSYKNRLTDKTITRLRNVTVTNAVVTMNKTQARAGILAGQVYFPIMDCKVQGSLEYPTDILSTDTSERKVGGICGEISALQCYAYRCSSDVTITLHDHPSAKALRANVGGFAGGFLEGGTAETIPWIYGIYESYAIATINFPARNLALSQTYAYIGGFIGKAHGNTTTKTNYTVIKDCFTVATLNVNAEVTTGVFTGMNYYPILNSYAVGTIQESTDGVAVTVGGFTGNSHTSYYDAGAGSALKTLDLNSCYFDDTVYLVNDVAPLGNVTFPHNGVPKVTADMKTQGTYVDWDYNSVWLVSPDHNNGYPVLLWMVPPPVYYNIIHYIKQHGSWVAVTATKNYTAADISDFGTAANALIQTAVTTALGTGQ